MTLVLPSKLIVAPRCGRGSHQSWSVPHGLANSPSTFGPAPPASGLHGSWAKTPRRNSSTKGSLTIGGRGAASDVPRSAAWASDAMAATTAPKTEPRINVFIAVPIAWRDGSRLKTVAKLFGRAVPLILGMWRSKGKACGLAATEIASTLGEINRCHDDDDRQGLQEDAQAHQLLRAGGAAALHHVAEAEQEDD